jgi:hypothetical protein
MKVNDMNVTVSIVTHNSDKIFLSLDSLIRSLGKDQSIQIKIFAQYLRTVLFVPKETKTFCNNSIFFRNQPNQL